MTELFESTIFCRIAALLILAFFYSVYFAKMISQKRRGIKTNQIGRRKERRLHAVETVMGIATLAVVPAQLVSVGFGWSLLPAGFRLAGTVIGLLGDVIFLISVLSMKDSWRAGIPDEDKTALVTSGIYRFSRNPAFLGFDLQYIGMLLLFFNPLSMIFSLFAAISLHFQILEEERFLTSRFGDEYSGYKRRVFRYFGRRPGK